MSAQKKKNNLPSPEELRAYYDSHPAPKVTYQIFVQRVKVASWPLEEALSCQDKNTPKQSASCKAIYEAVDPNDRKVDYQRFYKRILAGWKVLRAISTPLLYKEQDHRVYYDSYVGDKVDFTLFYNRITRGSWDRERAISRPALKLTSIKPLTPERQFYEANKDRAVASLNLFLCRVNTLHWDYEKALTQASLTQADSRTKERKYYDAHPNPQVTYSTYIGRILTRGWDMHSAISTPARAARLDPTAKAPPKAPKSAFRRNVPQEILDYYQTHEKRAQVPLRIYITRTHTNCWDKERALVTPVKPSNPVDLRSTQHLQAPFYALCRHQDAHA